jgi:hypothetical protein
MVRSFRPVLQLKILKQLHSYYVHSVLNYGITSYSFKTVLSEQYNKLVKFNSCKENIWKP